MTAMINNDSLIFQFTLHMFIFMLLLWQLVFLEPGGRYRGSWEKWQLLGPVCQCFFQTLLKTGASLSFTVSTLIDFGLHFVFSSIIFCHLHCVVSLLVAQPVCDKWGLDWDLSQTGSRNVTNKETTQCPSIPEEERVVVRGLWRLGMHLSNHILISLSGLGSDQSTINSFFVKGIEN